MELHLRDKFFVLTGATSGFGYATAKTLLKDGARALVVARGEKKLLELAAQFPEQVETLAGDITQSATIQALVRQVGERPVAGLLVNAGGPPAKSFDQTVLADWDSAYASLLRWKVELIQALLPNFRTQGYGRVLLIESSAVKQPIANLVLSTSLRLAVVGMAKTLANDLLPTGITVNVLAPGYHQTPAVERLFVAKAAEAGISVAEAMQQFAQRLPMGHMGQPDDLGSLAAWLLSPQAGYLSGQTISVDGGVVQFVMG